MGTRFAGSFGKVCVSWEQVWLTASRGPLKGAFPLETADYSIEARGQTVALERRKGES